MIIMNYERIKKQLIEHEGLRLEPYRCTAGKLTIGVGHNLDDKPISRDVAMLMLQDDIDDCIQDLQRNIMCFDALPPHVKEALINLCFNMGINRLLQFKKTLSYISTEDYDKAAEELLDSRYATQVGKRAIDVSNMIRGNK